MSQHFSNDPYTWYDDIIIDIMKSDIILVFIVCIAYSFRFFRVLYIASSSNIYSFNGLMGKQSKQTICDFFLQLYDQWWWSFVIFSLFLFEIYHLNTFRYTLETIQRAQIIISYMDNFSRFYLFLIDSIYCTMRLIFY